MKKFEEDLLLLEDQNSKLSKVGPLGSSAPWVTGRSLWGPWVHQSKIWELGSCWGPGSVSQEGEGDGEGCCPVGVARSVVHQSSPHPSRRWWLTAIGEPL